MKDRLTEIGFEVLDYIYGELAIMKGIYLDEVFVDEYDNERLGYYEAELTKENFLSHYYNDMEFFLSIIPVEEADYRRVLKDWVEERYKRKVGVTIAVQYTIDLPVL